MEAEIYIKNTYEEKQQGYNKLETLIREGWNIEEINIFSLDELKIKLTREL